MQGYGLLLEARRVEKLQLLQHLVEQYPQQQVLILALDFNEELAAAQLFQFFSNQNIQLCALINNAGLAIRGKFAGLSLSRQRSYCRSIVSF